MKTGEMNADLEYKGYTVRLINAIKDVIKNEVSSGNDKGEAHYLSLCLDLLKRWHTYGTPFSQNFLNLFKTISRSSDTRRWQRISSTNLTPLEKVSP